MKTAGNLREAFAGESQANRRYLGYGEKADSEGQQMVARLFRGVAAAETVHALAHLRAMGGVGSTVENLREAISGENYEHTLMYPEFMRDAEADGEAGALRSFRYANEVEKIHEGLYKDALGRLEAGESIELRPVSVCPVCGYTAVGDKPDRCPVCGTPGKRFMNIE